MQNIRSIMFYKDCTFPSFIKHTNIILLYILYKHADSVKKEILLLVTVGQTMPILTLRKAFGILSQWRKTHIVEWDTRDIIFNLFCYSQVCEEILAMGQCQCEQAKRSLKSL